MVQGFRKWPGGLYGSQIFLLTDVDKAAWLRYDNKKTERSDSGLLCPFLSYLKFKM